MLNREKMRIMAGRSAWQSQRCPRRDPHPAETGRRRLFRVIQDDAIDRQLAAGADE
jgi:hypothetical protein